MWNQPRGKMMAALTSSLLAPGLSYCRRNDMKQIRLTQRMVALVDDADFEQLSKHKWCAVRARGRWYAVRSIPMEKGKQTTIRMHRFIMNAPRDQQVDHLDGNGLNNQRSNLRICTSAQNNRNRRKMVGTSPVFKGVYWNKENQRWHAQITQNGHRHHLGYFDNEIDAAYAYDAAARKHFGEFACINFPRKGEQSALRNQEKS